MFRRKISDYNFCENFNLFVPRNLAFLERKQHLQPVNPISRQLCHRWICKFIFLGKLFIDNVALPDNISPPGNDFNGKELCRLKAQMLGVGDKRAWMKSVVLVFCRQPARFKTKELWENFGQMQNRNRTRYKLHMCTFVNYETVLGSPGRALSSIGD